MHRIFLSLVLICIWQSSMSQIDIQVTTLDSFTTSANGQQGVYSLNAVTHDSTIHLSYFYSDSTSHTWLMYGQRNQGSLMLDTVMEIDGYSKSLSSTAMQFDSLGNVWIYAGFNSNSVRYIKAFRRMNDEWQESFSLNQLGTPHQYVVAAPHAKEIGFAFCGIRIPPTNLYPIQYASFDGTSWNQVTVSEIDKSEKTKPSIISNDTALYITFAESRCPDTLVTRVYTKTDSLWSVSFEDVWVGDYDCSSLDQVTTKIGADDAGIYLLQDTHLDEDFPQFFTSDGSTWQSGDVFFDADWVHPFFMGSNIHTDPFHTVYWINQGKSDTPGLCLLETSGECGYVALPEDNYSIALQDMVILDGYAYIYYFEGNYNWPWGKPVTFREARISIDQIVPIQQPDQAKVVTDLVHAPNPMSGESTITCSISQTVEANLKIYDLYGRPIDNLFSGRLEAGQHTWSVNGQHLAEGLYICVLQTPDQQMSTTMVVVH